MPSDAGQVELPHPCRELRVNLDAVQRTLSRIPGLDDLTRDIDERVGFAIDPGIPRPVLPRDDERTAPTAPAVAAARQIPLKAGLNLQQVESDDG